MSGLIDTSVFCGYWPFRCLEHRTPETLKAHLEQRGVHRAWVSSSEAVLCPDPMQANEPLFSAVQGDSFFLPVGIVDITLAAWERDARICIERLGSRALKLLPNYHQYELSDPRVGELVRLAQEADIPVCIQIRMMDERSHHPLMVVPAVSAPDLADLANRHPEARFLACGAYHRDLKGLSGATNLWAEISLVESAQTLSGAVAAIGSERLVFGSHSPFIYFGAVAAKLDVDPTDVPREEVEAMRENNATVLLGDN